MREAAGTDGRNVGSIAAPRRAQQEQLLHWHCNRRMLLAYSTVGTPDYIAPEVLLKKGVMGWNVTGGHSVLSCSRCLLGSLLSIQTISTCRKIVNWRTHLKFPEEAKLSAEAAHPWFKGLPWEKLYEIDAAFKPEGTSELYIS